MSAKIVVDARQFDRLMKELQEVPAESMRQTYRYYKNATPIRSGNARRKTIRPSDTVILSDYAYAGRLDEGWSKQAPNGFTEASSNHLVNVIGRLVGRI